MFGEETVAAGDLTERYVLDRPLRVGGMGVVWVAHSKALNVPVALKILRSRENNAEAVERMANEAHAAASLGHPAIVRVLDFGESGGAPFIAMELLEGEDLAGVLEREGKIAPTRAVGLLLPIIDGLATAHARGIVHRDIKPENIFIARDAMGRVQPKVLDFGIAKLDDGRSKARLTQSGTLLGTLPYLSPEQAEGRDDVDSRADIWSLGVVLYELITGSQPFGGKTHNAFVRSITEDDFTRKPEIGGEPLWCIIDQCLKKAADDRWESMWALGEALALWLLERGVEVDAASGSLREGWLKSGVSGLPRVMPDAREAPLATTAVSCPPPPSRPRVPAPDPTARAVVLTVKLPRISAAPGPPRTGASRIIGVALLVALASGLWAFHQPPPGSVHSLRLAPPASLTAERTSASPRDETENASERIPRAPEPAMIASAPRATARTPALPRKRPPVVAKRALTPKRPSIDPEFGF